jgi:hypothetical protein
MTEAIEKNKLLVEKSLSLAEFKRKFNELNTSRDIDISFYAYILKLIASKDNELLKILAIT